MQAGIGDTIGLGLLAFWVFWFALAASAKRTRAASPLLLFENFLAFGGHGATITRTENFRQVISNPG